MYSNFNYKGLVNDGQKRFSFGTIERKFLMFNRKIDVYRPLGDLVWRYYESGEIVHWKAAEVIEKASKHIEELQPKKREVKRTEKPKQLVVVDDEFGWSLEPLDI